MNYYIGRRQFLLGSIITGASLALESYSKGLQSALANQDLIKVGIIESHYKRGVGNSNAIAQGVFLALQEINQSGGVLGKAVTASLVEPGKVANYLKTATITNWFGNPDLLDQSSSSGLFWSPEIVPPQVQFSPYTFYLGATPNQQLEPAVNWLLDEKGSDFFLIGNDGEGSRLSHAIVKQQLQSRGAKVAGEFVLPSSSLTPSAMQSVLSEIKTTLPQGGIILNTLSGSESVVLFNGLKQAKFTPNQYPVMSLGLTEAEVATLNPRIVAGHYLAQNYIHSLNTPENQTWVRAYRKQYPQVKVPSTATQAAYSMVYLWKQTVETAQTTTDVEAMREAAIGQQLSAPEGKIQIAHNHHLSRTPRIGQINRDGSVQTVAVGSEAPVSPIPWHHYAIALTGTGSPNLGHWPKPFQKGKTELATRSLWRGMKTSQLV